MKNYSVSDNNYNIVTILVWTLAIPAYCTHAYEAMLGLFAHLVLSKTIELVTLNTLFSVDVHLFELAPITIT